MKVFLFLIAIHFLFVSGCKKNRVPTVRTYEITKITETSATCGGAISDDGSGTVIERGICWSKGINPTVADSKTIEGAGAGNFISHMENLYPATTYFVKAYATNKAGTGYGMAMSFKTTNRITPLQKLYYQMVKDRYAVPDRFEDFETTFKNLENARLLFNQLTEDNYSIPDNFIDFLYVFGLKKKEDPGEFGLPSEKVFADLFANFRKHIFRPPH